MTETCPPASTAPPMTGAAKDDDQPVVADGRLAELQTRHRQHARDRGQQRPTITCAATMTRPTSMPESSAA